MRKYSIIIFCLALLLSGCNRNEAAISVPVDAKQNGNDKSATPVPNVGQGAQLIFSSKVEGTERWLLYRSISGNQNILTVYHTADSGKSWVQSSLPTKESWEYETISEGIFTSFSTEQKRLPNWILLTSSAGLGQMNKVLYRSDDQGNTWFRTSDASQSIDGYVTGLVFNDKNNGWVTASSHGSVLIPLYHTKDGGESWTLQKLDLPEGYKYGDVFPPSFDKSDFLKGTLKIEFRNDNKQGTFQYQTTDGGESWEIQQN